MGCRLLRQSTAVTVDMGPALDKTDGVTEEIGLSPTVYLSKAGAAQAARSSATAIAHDARGYYRVELDATDTGTLGMLRALFHDAATHIPVWEYFMVIPAMVYDSLVAGSDLLDVSALQLAGDAQSLTDLKDFADAGYDPATNKIEGVKLVDLITAYTGNTPQTGDSFARIGATGSGLTSLATAANLAAAKTVVDAIKAVTDLLPDAGALSSLATASSLSTAQTAITAIKAVTDLLPDAGALSSLAQDSTVAKASALSTAQAAITAIKAVTDALPNAGALTDLATAAALATAQTDLTSLVGRLTALRAGYLDNLSAGAVAQESSLAPLATAANQAAMDGKLDTISGYLDTEIQAIIDALVLLNADTDDIQARLPAALTAGGLMKSDALAVNGSLAAAVRLALAAGTMVTGTVDTTGFVATTTEFEADDITEATADHYNGRVIIFTSGALLGQAKEISDYALATGRGHFTVPALTESPANNSTFIIV